MSGYPSANSSLIDEITIMGLKQSPSNVMLNGAALQPDEWHWETMVVTIC